jgi:hypothetical protein
MSYPSLYSEFEINYWSGSDSLSTSIKLYYYTEKSIAMVASEEFGKSFSEFFTQKGISGKYNPSLKVGKGWIFPATKKEVLEELIGKIREGLPGKAVTPRISSAAGIPAKTQLPIPVKSIVSREIPTIATTIQTLLKLLDEVDTLQTTHIDDGYAIIVGPSESEFPEGDHYLEIVSSDKKLVLVKLAL